MKTHPRVTTFAWACLAFMISLLLAYVIPGWIASMNDTVERFGYLLSAVFLCLIVCLCIWLGACAHICVVDDPNHLGLSNESFKGHVPDRN